MLGQKPPLMPEGYNGWSLIDGEEGIETLKRSLLNLSPQENSNDHRYAQGILVGIASCLMACGMDYEDALQLIWQCSPNGIPANRIPESWRSQFRNRLLFKPGQRVQSKTYRDFGRITRIEHGVIFIKWNGEEADGQTVEDSADDHLWLIQE